MKQRVTSIMIAMFVLLSGAASYAADWAGRFVLIPVSAANMRLAPVQPAGGDHIVSIAHAKDGDASQAWIVTRKDGDTYAITSAADAPRVLTVKDAGTANGTLIVCEPDTGKASQRWRIVFNPNGSMSLLAAHAPNKGLDDFAGGSTPGARQDLWDYHAGDEHLQWVLRPIGDATTPEAYNDPKRLRPLAPKGRIEAFEFDDSRIFPGTRHTGHVFIPAQYDGSKPACVYVRQDGYNRGEKSVLESLIASGQMPVTIGVFVRPGFVPAPKAGTLRRRNRGLEYDGVGDRYVRFLTEELLPFVEKKFDLKLSHSGNDRCIAGGSSGGIAAFNAAWHRPDQFSRVFAGSGSFVAFRGGNMYPTLVRKFEAKPIRVYLTTGTHDMENCAGDWFLFDQQMDKALTFSGYEHVFHIIDGGHVSGWGENFPEAMRFLWKGWPKPVPAGPSAPRARDVILPGEGWTLAADGLGDASDAACNAKGEVFVADAKVNRIDRIGLDGKLSVFVADSGHANAVTVGHDGSVYSVSRISGKVMRYDASGKGSVMADGVRGSHVLARPDGSLYVTGTSGKAGDDGCVWRIAGGHVQRVDSGIKHATGLAYRPDQWVLAVADGDSRWVYSYQIADDGTLKNKERYFRLMIPDDADDAGAGGVCYAKEGQIMIATRMGVQICADDGPTQVVLPMPDRSRVLGVCFGGAKGDTLYALCGGKIWKRHVKVHGIGAFTPYVLVHGTPL